eukprot:1105284-Prymnesium_polylepis.1
MPARRVRGHRRRAGAGSIVQAERQPRARGVALLNGFGRFGWRGRRGGHRRSRRLLLRRKRFNVREPPGEKDDEPRRQVETDHRHSLAERIGVGCGARPPLDNGEDEHERQGAAVAECGDERQAFGVRRAQPEQPGAPTTESDPESYVQDGDEYHRAPLQRALPREHLVELEHDAGHQVAQVEAREATERHLVEHALFRAQQSSAAYAHKLRLAFPGDRKGFEQHD